LTDYLAVPRASAIAGALTVPPSKSATNRALLAAALTGDSVEIVRPLESEDTAALCACLVALGVSIVPIPEGVRVSGPLRADPLAETVLDAGASGTAARFLAAAAAAATPGPVLLTGSARLCERPIGELVTALRSAGARIAYRGQEGFLPILVEGGLRSGEVVVDASRSSQFVSALLLAGIAVDGGLSVRAAGPIASRPYISTTIETLRDLGHEVVEGESLFRVKRGPRPAARCEIPGDYSSAVALLAALAAAGGELALHGLRWPSSDADAGALPVLEAIGVKIAASAGAVTASASPGGLRAIAVRATEFPDAVPVLAALAALAPGRTTFSGIAHLRWKESDRIAALSALLSAAGATADADADGLTVNGPPRPPASLVRLPTFDDHRLVMAAAVLSLRVPNVLIEGPGAVAKSYPAFFRDLESVVRRNASR
jgi:3-phosphoshikimate 1-carboxyvinyltransferase